MPQDFDSLPMTLTVPQLMAILNVGRNTAYALVRSGRIRSARVGRQLRILKEPVKFLLFTSSAD